MIGAGYCCEPKIGDVFLVKFSGTGSEQCGIRPGVVFQNNKGNAHSPNIIILPLTSALKKRALPTHVIVPKSVGLRVDSMVLCENPECMSKDRLGQYLTHIPDEYMRQIAIGSLLASSAISFIDPDSLMSVWQVASSLNAFV